MTVTVLIADDDRLVRAGLRTIIDLEPDLQVVAEADDGAHAVAAARQYDVDVVLMDVRMPGVDGIQATRQLTGGDGSRVRVLMLTTFDDDDHVYDALRAGAGGFLLKRADPDDLVAAIRVVARGDTLILPAATRRLVERRRPIEPVTLPHPLSDREEQVLRLLAHGLSNSEIGQRLYLGTETVKTYVGRLLAKIGARDRVQAVVWAYDNGVVVPRRRRSP